LAKDAVVRQLEIIGEAKLIEHHRPVTGRMWSILAFSEYNQLLKNDRIGNILTHS
jgi:hypothetical protein